MGFPLKTIFPLYGTIFMFWKILFFFLRNSICKYKISLLTADFQSGFFLASGFFLRNQNRQSIFTRGVKHLKGVRNFFDFWFFLNFLIDFVVDFYSTKCTWFFLVLYPSFLLLRKTYQYNKSEHQTEAYQEEYSKQVRRRAKYITPLVFLPKIFTSLLSSTVVWVHLIRREPSKFYYAI